MILLPHLLAGAATGKLINGIPLALILAFLSHFVLDFLPHKEYSITNLKEKNWRAAYLEIIKVGLDFFSGLFLIFLFSDGRPIIFFCAFIAIIPDGLSLFKLKLLKSIDNFHQNKVHLLKNKKFSGFWRIYTQILIAVVSLIILKF